MKTRMFAIEYRGRQSVMLVLYQVISVFCRLDVDDDPTLIISRCRRAYCAEHVVRVTTGALPCCWIAGWGRATDCADEVACVEGSKEGFQTGYGGEDKGKLKGNFGVDVCCYGWEIFGGISDG